MRNSQNNEIIDLSEILAQYSGKWVVLSKDETEVIKSGDKLDDISNYIDQGIVMLVPDFRYTFTPSFV